MPLARFGGSFAPPLDQTTIEEYRALADASGNPQAAEIILRLCDMAETFAETPTSNLPGAPHPSGRGTIVPLEDAEVERIGDLVPWDYEIEAYRGVFDKLPSDSPLRTPAFHLLWLAKELEQDREPITVDKL